MFFKSVSLLAAVAALGTSVVAAPKIEFDTKTYACGSVVEGKTDTLSAVFKVKNTGDETLRLESVRPGCGCTVVKYDTLIAPGKSASILSKVSIKGLASGPVSKAVTVTSNATNEPTVRLTIEARVVPVIDVSESYLQLNGGSKTVFLSSRMKDLKISDVAFKSGESGAAPAWQKDLPAPVKFVFSATDSTRADGYRVFKLELTAPKDMAGKPGEFSVKTNNPDKALISIRGSM